VQHVLERKNIATSEVAESSSDQLGKFEIEEIKAAEAKAGDYHAHYSEFDPGEASPPLEPADVKPQAVDATRKKETVTAALVDALGGQEATKVAVANVGAETKTPLQEEVGANANSLAHDTVEETNMDMEPVAAIAEAAASAVAPPKANVAAEKSPAHPKVRAVSGADSNQAERRARIRGRLQELQELFDEGLISAAAKLSRVKAILEEI
jgi:hypothetical protein